MIKVPASVEKVLDASIRRVRKIYLLRGLAATLAMLIAALLAVMAVDAFVTIFSDAVRWLLSSLIYGSVVLVALFALVRPLVRPLNRLRMAKIIDQRHPENEECLTTLVELARSGDGQPTYSEALALVLEKKSVEAAAAVEPAREFTPRTVLRRLCWLVIVAVLLTLSFVLAPQLAGRLFVRAVAPWVDLGNLFSGDVTVTPGDLVVLKGDLIRIEVAVQPGLDATPALRISRMTDHGWGAESTEPLHHGVYETIADMNEPLWRYRVCAGPAVTRYYVVRVCELPHCEVFKATVESPAYTGRPRVEYVREEALSISAIEGSRVCFQVEPAGVGTIADFRLGGSPVYEVTTVSNRTTEWSLALKSAEGFEAPLRRGLVKSLVDMPPTVVIENPQAKSINLPPHAKFPLLVSASDDTGLSVPRLRLSLDNGEWRETRPLADFRQEGPSLWRGNDEIDLTLFALEGVRQVAFDVVIDDNRPVELGGPHSATSMPVVVRIEGRANALDVQTLQERSAESRKLLDEARRRLRDARNPAAQAKDAITRDKKVTEASERAVEKAAHEAEEAARRVQEMEAALRADGRFEPIVEKMRSTVERKLDPALAELEAAQFAERERRLEALEAALRKLADANEELERLEKPLQRRIEQLERMEKTRDLLDRQDALARTAAKILEEKPVDTSKLDAWKRMEQAAAQQAAELSRQEGDPEVDEAVRKMEKAVAQMEALKRELERAARKDRTEAQRAAETAQQERERAQRQLQGLQDAARAAKQAEELIERAKQHPNDSSRWMHQAADQERRALSQLEAADAPEAVKARQREAFAETLASVAKPVDKEDARAEEARARRAIEAEANRLAAAAEARNARNDNERAQLAAKREEERAQAQAAAIEAQQQAEKAMERKTAEGFKEARVAAERAAEAMTKAGVPEELREAQEAALKAAREIEKAFAAEPRNQAAERKAEELSQRAEMERHTAEGASRNHQAAEQAAAEAQQQAMDEQHAAQAAQAAAHAAQEAALKSPTAENQAKAEAAQEAAIKAQHDASEKQQAAEAARQQADRAAARSEQAAEAAAKAEAAAASAQQESALRHGDAAKAAEAADQRQALQQAAESARSAAQAQREAQAEVARAQQHARAAQQTAAEAQQAAAKAQQAAREAASAQAANQGSASEAQRRADAAQQAAEVAQAEALEAQAEAARVQRQLAAEDSAARAPGPASEPASAMSAGARSSAEGEKKVADPMRELMDRAAASQQATAAAMRAEQAAVAAERRAEPDREALRAEADSQLAMAAEAAKALAELTEAQAQARAENEIAAEFQAVEDAFAEIASLQEVAMDAVRDGDKAQASKLTHQLSAATKAAATGMEALSKTGALEASAQRGLDTAHSAQQEAAKLQQSASEHMAAFARDPRARHHQLAAQNDLRAALARQEEAQAAFAEARAAQSAQGEPQPAQGGEQSSQGESQPAQSGAQPGQPAAAAAQSLGNSLARQQAQLGLKPGQRPDQSMPPTQGAGSQEEGAAGGAMMAEISKLAKELTRKDALERQPASLERSGWFRIQGAAKDGLGEQELKRISPEYRDLVRRYFLKLAEQK